MSERDGRQRPGTRNSTATVAPLQYPGQAAVVRPDGLPRPGGWNRLPRDWG